MLSKDVCRKCINSAARDGLRVSSWGLMDDKRWEHGEVLCEDFWQSKRSIQEPPPEWCPYIVEHVVSQDVEQGNL